MKKPLLTLLPITLLLFACAPDFDLEFTGLGGGYYDVFIPPGTPATFIIYEPDSIMVAIPGDAYSVGYGFFDGPGSAMHKDIASYEPEEYFYELECIGSYGSEIHAYFDFYTTSLGQPLDSITVGMYYAHNATYRNADKSYQAYHHDDPVLNQQLGAVIQVTEKTGGRINGLFWGTYYEPGTGEIVTIRGVFENVYVHDKVW